MITIIVAASDNNVIGKNNDMLWDLPKDFKRFKKITSGHPIIMGRKTFESLPGILPNRTHIILTRDKNYTVEGCIVKHTLEDAILCANDLDNDFFIIGGGEIYKNAINYADKIELTRVHTEIDGDTYFPEIDMGKWTEVKRESITKDENHKFDFSYITYK